MKTFITQNRQTLIFLAIKIKSKTQAGLLAIINYFKKRPDNGENSCSDNDGRRTFPDSNNTGLGRQRPPVNPVENSQSLLADHKNLPENKFSDRGNTRKIETKGEELDERIKANEAKTNTTRKVTFLATQDTDKTTNYNRKDEKNKKIDKEDDENKETEETRKEATKTKERTGEKKSQQKADPRKNNNNDNKEEDKTGSTDLEWPIKREPRPGIFNHWHRVTNKASRSHRSGFTTEQVKGSPRCHKTLKATLEDKCLEEAVQLANRNMGLTVDTATAHHFNKTIQGCFDKDAPHRYGLKQEHMTAVYNMVVSLAKTNPNKLGVAVLTDENGEFTAFVDPKTLVTNAWRAVNHNVGAIYTESPDRVTAMKDNPMNRRRTRKQQPRQTEATANKTSGGES